MRRRTKRTERKQAVQTHLLKITESGRHTFRDILYIVIRLSLPTILAQISSIVMQYIDAAMVGQLGENASASIGLVSTTMWLFGGFASACAAGFSVQTAQLIGARKTGEAKALLKQSLTAALVFGICIGTAAASISAKLPYWLGGEPDVSKDAASYFFIYACFLPVMQLRVLCSGMLQSSGDMKTPSILNGCMCLLDVFFNFLLIFPSRSFEIFNTAIFLPAAGMGVSGAALGTGLSELVTALLLLYFTALRSPILKLERAGSWLPAKDRLSTAAKIAVPVALEHSALCGAQIVSTRIIAPLGTVSIAANSLGVTAESFCYMPGYGIGTAASTMVGQALGAGRKDLARRFANICVGFGTAIMTVMAILMYFSAPFLFSVLSPVAEIQALGTYVLRIEAFAEPLYAVSIIAAGALRGAGDTLIPGILHLSSMWGVRITAAALLAPRFGLVGVWAAMCAELCIRGTLFFIRLHRGKWLQNRIV